MKRTFMTKSRVLALLIAVTMIFSILPGYVFAADTKTDSSDSLYLAFTSDVHNESYSAQTMGCSAYRLNTWIDKVSEKLGVTFDNMGFCGDNGSGKTGDENAFWSYVAVAMDVVSENDNVNGDGFFIAGNHEYANGNFASTKNNTAEKIKDIGEKLETDDYIIYSFGPASGSQQFEMKNINALDEYLKTVDSHKPVFILSHYPIHAYGSRATFNASALIKVLNNYPNVIFLWGHNHSLSDTYYDTIYEAGEKLLLNSSTSSATEINFTYCAAGCMSDSEYSSGSAFVKGKGIVVELDGNGNVLLNYYDASANEKGDSATIFIGTPEENEEIIGTGETIEEVTGYADVLKRLGLFLGGDNGYDLDAKLNREQAITMVVRLLGAEKEAIEKNYSHPFTDVSDWAEPYVGYAYENKVTMGIADTLFGAGDAITEKEFLSFLLRMLKYEDGVDFTWDAPFELAKQNRLYQIYAAEDTGFNRGGAVVLCRQFLSAKAKDDTKTVAEELIEKGIFSADDYFEAKKLAEGGEN